MQRIDRTTQKVGEKYHVWYTNKFWKATKNQQVIEVEIETLKHLDNVCWFSDEFKPTLRAVVEHFKRMEQADLSYPIVLDPHGQILDGAHRVAMALAKGETIIKAVKMKTMPPPDEILDCLT